ncbi:MAG: 50S ribosomal protein L23 [Candidatus Micrarchaeaceae archaeon]
MSSIFKYPLATEKSIGIVDRSNTITYIVDSRVSKSEVKKEFELMFNVKVKSVNIVNMPKNTRKAFIKLAKGYNATDVALKLKLV